MDQKNGFPGKKETNGDLDWFQLESFHYFCETKP